MSSLRVRKYKVWLGWTGQDNGKSGRWMDVNFGIYMNHPDYPYTNWCRGYPKPITGNYITDEFCTVMDSSTGCWYTEYCYNHDAYPLCAPHDFVFQG